MSMMTDVTPTRLDAIRLFRRKRLVTFGFPAVILAYFIYIFFAFDIPGLADRARMDNAKILVADSYSYKTHVTRDNRVGSLTIAVEGENKGTWPEGTSPDWVEIESPDRTRIELKNGEEVLIDGNTMRYDVPGYGLIEAEAGRRGIGLRLPEGEVPDWISASDTRVDITTAAGRVTLTRARIEVMRYHFGWELFWFTLDSPFYGKSPGDLIGLAFSDERLVAGKSNLAAMAHDVWTNRMWQHRDVIWAIFETILMAFLGTMGAGIVALPLAFAAARNFSPFMAVRAVVRRVFDFVRGVDALIWTIILARAFGPGPLTGALAILITDTGTFGKLFYEALENVDKREIEGVQSTGARPLQRYRFGVIPQITPVLLSQLLYYLESNTRSATIIGAITGGGIGLLLTQAMITQKDWEEVSYYIILILVMVMVMDTVSGWLRRRLITSDDGGH
ncbi:phosphonate transport system permease protein [Roseovarius azorensis]|uniref:Phosphonate transport system permease protein n=1 Tax=Roseovarius azorensis TaxID=1287727 RepID=A0A1H7UDZ8_9RHOB|nr:phosphonate ABC transporter, permease protein PhnE [Roseovarius azorensis]SEL94477.1 phosphonate transport system permease protein [Roseovarius azorensis]